MRAIGIVAAAFLVAAPGASAQGTGGTAPAYPGNAITLETTGPIVAGQPAKLRIGGTLNFKDQTAAGGGYWEYISVQNAAVDARCEPSKSAQSSKFINLGDAFDANAGFGFFFDDGRTFKFPDERLSGPVADESLPFLVKPGMPEVVFCAYFQYVTDDVAWYQLPARVQQPGGQEPPPPPGAGRPACTVRDARIKRGRRLRLTCRNVTGEIRVRFQRRGARTRTITVRPGSGGGASVSTRRLRRGTYRVTVLSGTTTIGRRGAVRIR